MGSAAVSYPSVTQIIPSDFSKVKPDVLEAAALRGKLAHNALRLYALGAYDPNPLPYDVQPYFDSGRRWFDEYVDTVMWVEAEFVHPLYLYTGHPDLVAILRGNSLPSVIDYKTPEQYMERQWVAQLVSYTKMIEAQEKITLGPGVDVRLRGDGRPARANPVRDPETAWNGFLNALGAFNYFGLAVGGKT